MQHLPIASIIQALENFAPPSYQESYDNCGLITGSAGWACTGVLCTLDATEAVVLEAVANGCNMVVAHHPIVFGGLKKINGKNYVEQAIITAIKNDIAIYAIHTNADNVLLGVNNAIANALGLVNTQILSPKTNLLAKLITYIPIAHVEQVRKALFDAGIGIMGNYSEVSFSAEGTGTYKANEAANPFIGDKGQRHEEQERKLEMIFPAYMQKQVVKVLIAAHPYEEVAYDIIPLANEHKQVGSGMVGHLPEEMPELDFLAHIKKAFGLQAIRHTPLLGKNVSKVAICGGAGSFLIGKAIAVDADFYITADVKYHEFFDAENKLVIADIGHWESEQYTVDLLIGILQPKFPTFAVLKSGVVTNPVHYFL
ncbi:Nif3-like dinuclear metal center hexameric protein [Parasediminibacterium sp. JCM 36343]|uniref:Nif3-like dinuclear metal center hexameric protein n=1 Tax=Parasediminibacterium sp. JCM 36343 TaxID=3374279 RepID=UPI00397D2F3C